MSISDNLIQQSSTLSGFFFTYCQRRQVVNAKLWSLLSGGMRSVFIWYIMFNFSQEENLCTITFVPELVPSITQLD